MSMMSCGVMKTSGDLRVAGRVLPKRVDLKRLFCTNRGISVRNEIKDLQNGRYRSAAHLDAATRRARLAVGSGDRAGGVTHHGARTDRAAAAEWRDRGVHGGAAR